jgi:MFS family permease
MRTSSFIALCAAALSAAFGYAAVMPLLPTLIGSLMPGLGKVAVAGHAGAYAAVYMIAVVIFSPLWGVLSDRYGTKAVMSVGLVGSSVAAFAAVFAAAMWSGYTARALQGAFAAGVLTAASAALATIRDTAERARKMAALASASLLGFFAAPMITAGIVSAAAPSPVTVAFHATALIAAAALVLIVGLLRAPVEESHRSAPYQARPLPWRFIGLNLLAYFGLGGFEVALPLASSAWQIEAAQVALLFAECSLVMLAAQGALMAAAQYRARFPQILGIALAAYAIGLFILAGAGTLSGAAAAVGLIGTAAGLVLPLISYLVTLEIASRPGVVLGALAAAGGLGQAAGSAAGGIAYGYSGALVFVAMGIVVTLGAFLVARGFTARARRDGRRFVEDPEGRT